MFSSTINAGGRKNLGVTSPISTDKPRLIDLQKTEDLKRVLLSYNLFESKEEMAHRSEVLTKINKLTKKWIKDISIKKNIPLNISQNVILTFGSYKLGVHTRGADIDTLCIAPLHVDRSDFFSSFVELLKEQKEVKYLKSIPEAYVPVIKINFDGIEIDILFAKLELKDIPEDIDLNDVALLKNLDQKCVRSLNGLRVTDEILNLVPDKDNFRLALYAIKLWAKKQCVYSNKLGYLSGVSLAMLVARTCQLYPKACAATLVHKFFFVFSQWPWPKPVILKEPEKNHFGFEVWDPRINQRDSLHLMPIITPSYPHQNSTYNVSSSTLTVIQKSFNKGLSIMNEIMSNNKVTWDKLYEPVNFFTLYRHYIVLIATAPTKKDHLDWSSFVESRVRILVAQLQNNPKLRIAHINPDTFTPINPEPSRYQSMWFIGLKSSEKGITLDLTNDIQKFVDTITNQARRLNSYRKDMDINRKYVRREDLQLYLHPDILMKSKKETVEHSVTTENTSDSITKILRESNSKDSKHVASENSCSTTINKRPLDVDSQDRYPRPKRLSTGIIRSGVTSMATACEVKIAAKRVRL